MPPSCFELVVGWGTLLLPPGEDSMLTHRLHAFVLPAAQMGIEDGDVIEAKST